MRTLLILLLSFVATPLACAKAERPGVDLLLVLAADISNSVTPDKFKLQREGYMYALTHPAVVRAATSGPHRRIAVAYIEWSGDQQQTIVINWTLINSAASAEIFTGGISERERAFSGMTAIGSALHFCMHVLKSAPFDAPRKIIDISGDGTNNDGMSLKDARNKAERSDITINALAILTASHWDVTMDAHINPSGGLAHYFRNNVITGPGSFVVPSNGFGSFRDAILKKLILEIAMR